MANLDGQEVLLGLAQLRPVVGVGRELFDLLGRGNVVQESLQAIGRIQKKCALLDRQCV